MTDEKDFSLKKYIKAFIEFEKYINNLTTIGDNNFDPHKGYLINLEKIEEIKTKINYTTNKNNYNNLIQSPSDNQNRKLYTIGEIEFKNSNYLLNMLLNKNKYIIINRNLWKFLCKEGKENNEPIIYYINYSQIKFRLKDGKELTFTNWKNNQISKDSFYSYGFPEYYKYESDFNNIEKNIYNKVKEYYDYEIFFKNSLSKVKKEKHNIGYLVDINWFYKWENFFDYSHIKFICSTDYLEQGKKKKDIIDCLIYIQEYNKENKINLEEPTIQKYSNKNELESFLQTNKLVIVDTSLFPDKFKGKKIYYYLYDNKIEFYFEGKDPLILDTKDNIISIKNKEIIEEAHLMQLSRIIYFRKFLKLKMFNESEKKNDNNSIILIKKEIIDKYLSYFKYTVLENLSNSIPIDYKNIQKQFHVIVENIKIKFKNYYEELKTKEKTFSINFEGEEYFLKPQPIEYDKKTLFYISDFEIIDEEIFSFFKEYLNINNDYVISGKYIAKDEKVFLNYNYNSANFYEIGSIDITNGNFIIEYILDEIISFKDKVFEYFNNQGIKNFLKNVQNNMIKSGIGVIGHCYDFKQINNEVTKEITMADNIFNIDLIISTFINLYLFENKIKNNIDLSKKQINDLSNKQSNPLSSTSFKLINEKFLEELKNLFDYQNLRIILEKEKINNSSQITEQYITNFLKKNESYKTYLLSKKQEFFEVKKRAFEIYNIQNISYSEQGENAFQYPMEFNILNADLFNLFLTLLDMKGLDNSQKPKEIILTYNNGNIVFRGLEQNKNNVGDYMSFLYIYSSNIEHELTRLKYFPEAILAFKNDSDLLNKLPSLMKENIIEKLLNSKNNFKSSYGFKICLMFNETDKNKNNYIDKKISDDDLFDNNSNKYFNKLLNFSFQFTYVYNKFYYSNKPNQKQSAEIMYLINKNYIDEIKSLLHFGEISSALKMDKNIENLFFNEDMNYMKNLKKSLDRKTLIDFYNSEEKDIEKNLSKPELSKKLINQLSHGNSNDLFYYNHFQIINKKILDMIGEIDKNLKGKYIETSAFFSDNKVIVLLEDNGKYIINVGIINSSDELKIEYLIQSKYTYYKENDLQYIFDAIKIIGHKHFYDKYIIDNEISMEINHKKVKATKYNIYSEENQINNITSQKNDYICDKLKAMILIAIFQINFDKFRENNQKKIEKVYLMNYNYLKKYKYYEIISLLKHNNDILKLVENLGNSPNQYDLKSVELIIEKLKNPDLFKINKELQNINFPNINLEAKSDNIQLKDKSISIFREFILVPKYIIDDMKNKSTLPLNTLNKVINYTYNNGDIFAFNYNYEYYILFGNIITIQENQLFDLKYILNYDLEYTLKEELKLIQKNGIEHYKAEKTVFNEENSKDLISPIFDETRELGNFYKYFEGFNYQINQVEDYNKYLNEGNFFKVCKLYYYYIDFKKNLEKNVYMNKKSYYLINKDVMNQIKKDYNYIIISNSLNNIQFPTKEMNNKKKMLYILKNLSTKINEAFIKDTKKKDRYLKDFSAPNKVTFTIPEPPNESINIYNNFEIIDSSIAKEFIDEIYGSGYEYYMRQDENFIECTIRDGKIIVYYPYSKLKNNKYVYQIGSINQDNTFIPEYLIIYLNNDSHFEHIKYDLNNYLSSKENQFVNGICPITKDPGYYNDFELLGKIVNLSKINNSCFVASNAQFGKNTGIDNNYGNNGEKTIKKPGKSKTDWKDNQNNITTYQLQKYNLEEQTITRDIKSNYNLPPLIGLDNIGATCYMNATLQCLCNITKFVNYFKYNKFLKERVKTDLLYTNNMLLSSSFKLLIEELWPDRLYFNNNPNPIYNQNPNYRPNAVFLNNNMSSNNTNKSYAPKEFKDKISEMNPLFKGVAANDAKDLVNFLIMTLHDELNTAEKKTLASNAINQDQRNQQLMFTLFSQDFMNNNKSIISDLFYGVNYNIVQCQNCLNKTYNYQTYFFLVFPLEEVRIFKSQNNFNNNFNYNMNFNNNEVNIYDCFLYDQRINYMMGNNAMYCNFCKGSTNTQMCTYISFGPEILIIILNRGQGIQYNVKINFVEQLNLYNFIEHKETGFNYQLIGVITHLGESGMSGHFIAYCKNPISNSWYRFNDSIVSEVNYANFKTEVIDFAMPYLLFYQKVGA